MNAFLSGPMRKLANMGRMGDTELAHVTPEEKRLLKAMGGSGTINPRTGMPEYFSPALLNFGKKPKKKTTDTDTNNNTNTGTTDTTIGAASITPWQAENFGMNTDLALTEGTSEESPGGADITPQEGAEIISKAPGISSEDFKSFLFSYAPQLFFNKGFIPYDSTQRFSGFDPMQMRAFGAINQFVDEKGNVITPSEFSDASSAAGAIAGTGGTTGFRSTYDPATSTSQFKTAGQDQEAFQRELDARMNPFTQGVINQLQRDISEQQQLALGRTGEQARAAGAFGGSRQGVAEALTSGRYGDAFARTAGQLRADQFNRAMAGADSDRARAEQFRQGAFGQTEQSKQFADAARQRAAATRLAAASDLRATGQAIDDATATRINALSAAGKQRQALDQALKDFQYQQFLEAKDFDTNQLFKAAGLLGSAPGDYYAPSTSYYGRDGGVLGDFFNTLFGEPKLMG